MNVQDPAERLEEQVRAANQLALDRRKMYQEDH